MGVDDVLPVSYTHLDVYKRQDDGDPVFCVTDLLPHLGTEQMKRPATEVIKGEDLNLLIGSRPFRDDEGSDCLLYTSRCV